MAHSGASKVEQYEIEAYKGLIQLALELGESEVAGLLQQNLQEEKQAADTLESMSMNLVKQLAAA